jgi:hypothetical protein
MCYNNLDFPLSTFQLLLTNKMATACIFDLVGYIRNTILADKKIWQRRSKNLCATLSIIKQVKRDPDHFTLAR